MKDQSETTHPLGEKPGDRQLPRDERPHRRPLDPATPGAATKKKGVFVHVVPCVSRILGVVSAAEPPGSRERAFFFIFIVRLAPSRGLLCSPSSRLRIAFTSDAALTATATRPRGTPERVSARGTPTARRNRGRASSRKAKLADAPRDLPPGRARVADPPRATPLYYHGKTDAGDRPGSRRHVTPETDGQGGAARAGRAYMNVYTYIYIYIYSSDLTLYIGSRKKGLIDSTMRFKSSV